jgi:hypothetical protein
MPTIKVKLPNGSMQSMSYPDGWSDDQVKSAISKHFPKDQNQENEAQRTGLSGIGQDVSESLKGLPEDFMQLLRGLPGEIGGAGRQAVTDPVRAIINTGGGIRKGIEGVINTPSNIASYLDKRDIGRGGIEDFIKRIHIPDSGLEQSLLGDKQSGDQLLQGIGSFAPYARIGAAARGLEGVAKTAGAGALYGVGQNEDPLRDAAMAGTFKAVPEGVSKLDPAKLFRGSLPPEELAANYEAAKGTNTPLGRVVESPTLSGTFESLTSQVPFTGAKGALK